MNKTLTFFASLLFTFYFCSASAQVWGPVGTGTDNIVNALTVDSKNNKFYVGGNFTKADGTSASSIALYNAGTWSALGNGITGKIYAIYADTSNGLVYVGGDFALTGSNTVRNIAVWDGTTWSPVSVGLSGIVYAITKFNGQIIAGGSFTLSGDNLKTLKHIAKYNGTNWDTLGSNGVDGTVNALATINNTLYVGGKFNLAGKNIVANNLAKWNGTAWDSVGSNGVNAEITALTNINDTLYVGGLFTTAGNTSAASIAKWDGTTWSAFGAGLNGSVKAITSYNGKIHAAGTFTLSGSSTLNYVGEWDGTSWNSLGGGFKSNVNALAVYNASLYAGGKFNQLDIACPAFYNYIAAWGKKAFKASFSSTNKAICSNRTVTFTDKSGCPVTTRKWTFTGGSPSTSSVESPVITYTANGTFAVKLVVSNQYGTDSTISNAYVTVADPVFNTAFVNNEKYVCANINDSVTIDKVPTNYNFYVQPTDGYRKWPAKISFGPSNTTLYAITYTNTTDGCVNSTQLIVVVKPQPAKPVMSRMGDTLYSSYKFAVGNQWYRGVPAPNPNMNPGPPAIVSGATNFKFLMTIPNVGYSVTYTDSLGCWNESGIFVPPYLVGLAEKSNLIHSMNVYPNPSSNGKFQLSFEGAESADYSIELINVPLINSIE